MDDTISRAAAIDAAVEAADEWDGGYSRSREEIITLKLRMLPSAQPEQKKGRWFRNDNGTYTCSVCQSWIPEEQHYYARYCLHCGADMRGEDNETD